MSQLMFFAPIIAHMANLSFVQGHFPKAFKTAQVTPLLKKPCLDKTQYSNCRSISNLSVVSKVLERLALARLQPHLQNSVNFAQLQPAFCHGHSTETALLRVTNDVFSAADERCASLLVGLDISAAFDTICHNTLLGRLQTEYGICDVAC